MLRNTCNSINLGKTTTCLKLCEDQYCTYHLNLIIKNKAIKPCKKCGKGVHNLFQLCVECGYLSIQNRWKYLPIKTKRYYTKKVLPELLRKTQMRYQQIENDNYDSYIDDDDYMNPIFMVYPL